MRVFAVWECKKFRKVPVLQRSRSIGLIEKMRKISQKGYNKGYDPKYFLRNIVFSSSPFDRYSLPILPLEYPQSNSMQLRLGGKDSWIKIMSRTYFALDSMLIVTIMQAADPFLSFTVSYIRFFIVFQSMVGCTTHY